MSFNPNTDGHIIWNYMHTMAANATNSIKRQSYIDWLNSLKNVFPCELCRKHLIVNLNNFPVEPYGSTNVALFYHSWKLHDTVNEQLHKPQSQRLTYDQAFAIYFKTNGHVGTHKPQAHNSIEDHQRFIVSAGNINKPEQSAESCSSCQAEEEDNIVLPSYPEHKNAQRRKYLPKN